MARIYNPAWNRACVWDPTRTINQNPACCFDPKQSLLSTTSVVSTTVVQYLKKEPGGINCWNFDSVDCVDCADSVKFLHFLHSNAESDVPSTEKQTLQYVDVHALMLPFLLMLFFLVARQCYYGQSYGQKLN